MSTPSNPEPANPRKLDQVSHNMTNEELVNLWILRKNGPLLSWNQIDKASRIIPPEKRAALLGGKPSPAGNITPSLGTKHSKAIGDGLENDSNNHPDTGNTDDDSDPDAGDIDMCGVFLPMQHPRNQIQGLSPRPVTPQVLLCATSSVEARSSHRSPTDQCGEASVPLADKPPQSIDSNVPEIIQQRTQQTVPITGVSYGKQPSPVHQTRGHRAKAPKVTHQKENPKPRILIDLTQDDESHTQPAIPTEIDSTPNLPNQATSAEPSSDLDAPRNSLLGPTTHYATENGVGKGGEVPTSNKGTCDLETAPCTLQACMGNWEPDNAKEKKGVKTREKLAGEQFKVCKTTKNRNLDLARVAEILEGVKTRFQNFEAVMEIISAAYESVGGGHGGTPR
ncbi:hypothetical protein BJY04DRAFT_214140 [Aspergillus karnatakaensis]|uniref:uncharacterized protein n=1 Tax=Aspergillus karnatakaensis TaxID=1810916 RepID=UPI003CCD93E8